MNHLIKKISLTTFLLTSLMSQSAHSANLEIVGLRLGGLGCPTEKTQVAMAPDKSSASIIFDQFVASVPQTVIGPKASPNIHQLACNMFLDVSIPAGFKIDSLDVQFDIRGNAILDTGVMGGFRSFIMSANGGLIQRANRGPVIIEELVDQNILTDRIFDFTLSKNKSMPVASNCSNGQQNIISFHIQNHLVTQITRGYENRNATGTMTVDSSDIKGGMILRATTSRCQSGINNRTQCTIERVGGRSQMVCR